LFTLKYKIQGHRERDFDAGRGAGSASGASLNGERMKKSIQAGLCSTTPLSLGTLVGAALLAGVALVPAAALAQSATPQAADAPAPSQEIVVTANHRDQKLEAVPYSMSVVNAKALNAAGVTDLVSLTQSMPGLAMYDVGTRSSAATVPIIRGINATAEPARNFRSFEQSPVGVYIGNTPIQGYVQLDDIKQVEVLRGPQGTLYGAGSLGGAIRILPNDPELGKYSGSFEGSLGSVSHAAQPSYTLGGTLNIPVGETLAIRGSVKYARDPGFITAYGLEKTNGSCVSCAPVLANPSDVVNSSGEYYNKKDWNYQDTLTTRVAALWQPVSELKIELAYMHSYAHGDGGNAVNPDYAGGTSPFDSNETLPAGGKYSTYTRMDEPWGRNTNVFSLDVSYDAGFATLTSSSSLQATTGHLLQDDTYDLQNTANGGYTPYYAGVPANPRFLYDYDFTDHEHTFSQEVRLVSKGGPDKKFDFALGAFYENQATTGAWTIAVPGSPERSVAQGCTTSVENGGCAVIAGPNDVNFQQIDTQRFTDFSVYGEVTWHVTSKLQMTGGVRHFSQWFTDEQSYLDYTFPTYIAATPHRSTAGKFVGKADVSYEYAHSQFVYALWSQGFRRGGANSVPLTGPFKEDPSRQTYLPDETNNFEAGIKGHLPNGMHYTLDGFYILWSDPQISASLPSGNLAVYNAKSAISRGFEAEVSGPTPLRGLSYSFSAAYADAHLTAPLSLAANNGAGVIVPGEITAASGAQMPGSPKFSTGLALNYVTQVADGYQLTTNLNGNYRSTVPQSLGNGLGATSVYRSSQYAIVNASVDLKHGAWHLTVYAKNLINSQWYIVPPTKPDELDGLANEYTVNRPREVGLRLGYSF
jgi:iron complex outermembrane recepter protein